MFKEKRKKLVKFIGYSYFCRYRQKHSLLKPSEFDKLPIYMVENPSKDFYFPITIDDIKNVLAQLPLEHVEGLTHIWLRKTNKKENIKEFIRLVVVFASLPYILFRKAINLFLGEKDLSINY